MRKLFYFCAFRSRLRSATMRSGDGMELRRAAVLGGTRRPLRRPPAEAGPPILRRGRARAGRAGHHVRLRGRARIRHPAQPGGGRSRTLRDIVAAGYRHDMTMQTGGRVVRVHNDRLIGIARTELLAVLQRHAEKAGVRLEFGARQQAQATWTRTSSSPPTGSAAAPGEAATSAPRSRSGAGCTCGAGPTSPSTTRCSWPVETEYGTFVTHAYPYSPQQSTFMIETDEATWRRAGFDVSDEDTARDSRT